MCPGRLQRALPTDHAAPTVLRLWARSCVARCWGPRLDPYRGSGRPDDPHSLDEITASSSDAEIVRSFEDAFDDGPWPGIAQGIYLRARDGKRGKYVRYWGWARSVAEELLRRTPRPGRDYALTELVHCGSRHEVGVWKAVAECVPRYFDRVMSASPARVVLVVGAVARDIVRATHPELRPSDGNLTTGVLGGRDRLVAYMPHPSAFGPKTVEAAIGKQALATLRSSVRK